MRAYFGRLLIVAQLLLILCFMRIATAQTDTPDGLLLERFESQLKAEEGKLLGGRTESSSSQVADGKDVTAYQLIASREELSYLKLATDARGLQPIFNTTAKDLVTYLLPSNDAFRTLLREVNRGRQPPRGANQSEFYLLSSLTKDPIVPIILVYNIFPNRVSDFADQTAKWAYMAKALIRSYRTWVHGMNGAHSAFLLVNGMQTPMYGLFKLRNWHKTPMRRRQNSF